MLPEQKLKLFMVAGNMEETWETRHILLWKKVPPHSPMEEGSKHFVVSIPIFFTTITFSFQSFLGLITILVHYSKISTIVEH
jgi:hypothetical protein